MNFHVPKRWAYLMIVGLVLLAVAGASNSVENAMRDNYMADCGAFDARLHPDSPRPDANESDDNETDDYTPPTPAEREQCREARMPVTVLSVVNRATLGPGIAIIALTAVFLVAAAITGGRR